MRAQLRRAKLARASGGEARIEADDVVIDLVKRSVTRAAAMVHLTPIEWDLLRALATNAGRTMTHRQLFAQESGAQT